MRDHETANIFDQFNHWLDSGNNLIRLVIAIIAAVALLVVAWFAGYGFLTALFTAVILAFAIWRALPTLVTSIFFAVLLKATIEPLKLMLALWLGGAKAGEVQALVNGTGYIALLLMIFLILLVIKYVVDTLCRLIGSFQPVVIKQHIGDRHD